MLVLSRKIGEEIRIGENIRLRVLEIQGNKVRLGIVAPMEVPVHREEVYSALQMQDGHSLVDSRG